MTSRSIHWSMSLTLLLSFFLLPLPSASAHRDGCHAAHSCPSDSGSYVCGDTGNFSQCGYSSLPSTSSPRSLAGTYEPVQDDDPPAKPRVSGAASGKGGRVSFVLNAEKGSRVVVKSGGKKYASVTATGPGQKISFKAPTGTHQYVVTATDGAGNKSVAAKFAQDADADAPSLQGLQIIPGTSAQARSALAFAAGEAVKYAVSVDGKKVAAGKTGADRTEVLVPAANGKHSVVVKLVDGAGNTSKVARDLEVDVESLEVVAAVEGTSTSGIRTLRIRGTEGATGLVTGLGGERSFAITGGEARIDLDLQDGQYDDVSVTLADEFGRTGQSTLGSVLVDSVAPSLKVARRGERSTRGHLVLLVTAERSAAVVWRVLDDSDDEVASGDFVAGGSGDLVDVDLEEGDYRFITTVTDEAGNEASEESAHHVDPDPWGVTEWVIFVFVLIAVIWFGLRRWRHRHERRARREQAKHDKALAALRSAHEAEKVRHQQAMADHARRVEQHRADTEVWEKRGTVLAALVREAESFRGEVPENTGALFGLKLKADERLYSKAPGALVELRSKQNVMTPVVAAQGMVTVTDRRVVFETGLKKREWAFDKLEQVQEESVGVLIGVSHRKTLSGVDLGGEERTLLHLRLALADALGGRGGVVQDVREALVDHDKQKPVAPPPAPEPPVVPVELQAAKSSSLEAEDVPVTR